MKQDMSNKEVILLSTHFVSDFVIEKYKRIRREVDNEKYDVVLLLNMEEGDNWEIPQDILLFMTDSDSINALGYQPIAENLLPGSCHFPVLRFFLDNPSYKFYWFVEYDVEFKGNWADMFADCTLNLCDYDFLSCHVEKFNKLRNAQWMWWRLRNYLPYKLEDCVKGFNPICRYSNRALVFLDTIQKQGCSAHSEVLITSCLHQHGFKIGDLGGKGKFVPDGFLQKYYITYTDVVNDGTMRYRPIFSVDEINHSDYQNVLFHPVKSDNN